MRRKEREITQFEELVDILKKNEVVRLAFIDGDYPYILPFNFGLEVSGTNVALYFHSATVGKKLDILTKNNRVAFEADSAGRFVDAETACGATYKAASICGRGTMTIVPDDDKRHALTCIMRQYSQKEHFEFDPKSVAAVTILKLTVEELTGKRVGD